MLFLLFRLGDDLYAIEAAHIGEVLPLVRIKALPGAPVGVCGLINHRGAPVPVIDLSTVTLGRPSSSKLSTRIVLVRDAAPDGTLRWLGLILEQATETLRRDPADFRAYGAANQGTCFLGPVLPEARGLIQWIDPRKLLPPAIKEMLFRNLVEPGHAR